MCTIRSARIKPLKVVMFYVKSTNKCFEAKMQFLKPNCCQLYVSFTLR